MARLSRVIVFQNVRVKKLTAGLSLALILLPLLTTSLYIVKGEENNYILNEEFNTLGPEWKRVQAGWPDVAELRIVNGQLQSTLRKSPGTTFAQLGVVYEKPFSPPIVIELKQRISNITTLEESTYSGLILADRLITTLEVHMNTKFFMVRQISNTKGSFSEISYRSDDGKWHWGDAHPDAKNLTEVKWKVYWKDVGEFEVYQDVGTGYKEVYDKRIPLSFRSAYIYLIHHTYSSKDIRLTYWDWIRVYRPTIDVTPPLVKVVRPANNETIAMGPFPGYDRPLIEVNASDDVGLQRVEYYINPLGRSYPPSGLVANKSIEHSYWNLHSWLTAPIVNLVPTNAPRRTFASEPHYYPNGKYVITVIAYDKAGNSAKDEISVSVDNGLDIIYPVVVDPVKVAKEIFEKLGIPMEAYNVVGEAKLLYKPEMPAVGLILVGDTSTRLHFFSYTEAKVNEKLYNATLGYIYPSPTQLTAIKSIVVKPPVVPDFNVTLTPTFVTIEKGRTATVTLAITAIGGYNRTVSLYAFNQPADVTVSFNPTLGIPPFTSTISISVARTVPEGTYPITISARGADGKTHSVILTLNVITPADFKLAVSSSLVFIEQGKSVTTYVNVNKIGNFSSPVSLKIYGLPSGVNALFDPSSAIPPFISKLTILTSPDSPIGVYTLSIVGEGGGIAHSASMLLNITKAVRKIVTHTGILRLDKSVYQVGEIITITLEDPDLNMDPSLLNVVNIAINSTSDPVGITVSLVETGVNTGIFTGKVLISESPGVGKIYAKPGDTLMVLYKDVADAEGKARDIVVTVKVRESIMKQVPKEVYAWQPSIILVHMPSEFKTLQLSATIDVNVNVSGINIPDPLPPTTFTIPLLPIPHVRGWYITSIPGLPAGTYKDILWSFKISSFVNYDLLLDGVKYASGSYSVKEGIPELKLSPVVIATVYDVIKDPEIIEETLGLGPRGWIKGSGESMKILVIAYDDKGLKEVNTQYSIDGGSTWTNLPLTSDPLGGVISKIVDTVNNAIRSIENAVRVVKPDFELPKIYLPMVVYNAEIPGQPTGKYVLFRASATDIDGHSSLSPTGLYYVVDKTSATKVLIIDPHVELWLLSQNAKQLLNTFRQFVSYQFPAEFIKNATSSLEISDIFEKYGMVPFHHWELLGKYYNLYITWPSENLGALLNEFTPNTIILSNLWLGIDNTPFEWDLRDLGVDEDLISYVRQTHAGIIATHGTLNDLKTKERDIGVPGHIGESVEDANALSGQERTIATLLGMPHKALYEVVKDQVCSTFEIPPIPLEIPYVPFDGSMKATEEGLKHDIWRDLPEEIKIVIPGLQQKVGFSAYTEVGWQLAMPKALAEIGIKSAQQGKDLAKRTIDRFSVIVENVSQRLIKAVKTSNLSLQGLDWGMDRVYRGIASARMTLGKLEVELPNVPGIGDVKRTISFDMSRLLELIPLKLIAMSEDGKAGILAFNRYFDEGGYRSVFFSFEIEAIEDTSVAEKLLVNSIEWTKQWRFTPPDFLGLIPIPKDLAEKFKAEIAKIPGKEVLSREILLNELGFFELPIYVSKPARLHILVVHPTSDKITVKVVEGAAKIMNISKPTNKLTKVEIEAKTGKFVLGIKADPESSLNPAYVMVKEAITIGFTVSTSKTEYKPGEVILINGSGATPDGIVTLKVINPDGMVTAVDQVTASADGRFYARFVIPSRIPTGEWTKFGYYKLEATDSATGKIATTEFLIRPAITLPIQLVSLTIVDPFTGELVTPKPGKMCMIRAEIKNVGEAEQPLLYIVQIKDEKGAVIHIGTAEATLSPGASIKLGVGWAPSEAKTFTVEIFVWKSFTEPIALMKKHSITITVLPS